MTEKYLDLIPNWNLEKPKFSATISALVEPLSGGQVFVSHLPKDFDLDVAIGSQLDIVGEWVGRTRYVQTPIPNVWFSFDVEGVGFDQGTWRYVYDLDAGMTRLDDDHYRILLRAKIAANQWDGTIPGAKAVLDPVFGEGTHVFIQDHMDMSMTIGVSGQIPSAVTLALLAGGYIPLKPSGVRVNYLVVSVNQTAMFGFDMDTELIAGFDVGSWGAPPI
ncbi:DUF2612 domain-containing protein [Ochrobactrum quorumnocens]|uniref:DUF2612 domain-containing protein n=1 Tax=Ochrobactrum quorumnocens TaxID=271865 RepID=A0A5N1K5M8_9HYPH|nr:DUF2612 domain-containing protein [[Ochrobactrum] quorumnocens]KAA9370919.1 DUF2612 domain-containing protein [[Ochrobactrum] quorumnocens]